MTLQAALPRELYVDPASFARERERVLLRRVDLRRPGRRPRSPPRRSRWPWSRCSASRWSLTTDADGALHAAYNVCRHRGSQLFPTEPGSGPQLCGAKSIRCPYHSWTYALDGSLLRAPHTEEGDVEPGGVLAAPARRRDLGRVRLRPPDARARPRRCATASVARPGRWPTTTWPRSSPARPTPTRSRPTGRSSPRTTTSATTAARCTPSCRGWCPSFAGGGQGLDWDEGIPHREGAWTFTMSGTTTRSPLPGLNEAEQVRHKGELVYPNLMLSCSADHVAAFVLAPAGRRPHGDRVPPAVRGRRGRLVRLRPDRRRRASGTWSTGRTGRSASRCSAGCPRAPTPTAGSRRWRTTPPTSAAGCCRGWVRC